MPLSARANQTFEATALGASPSDLGSSRPLGPVAPGIARARRAAASALAVLAVAGSAAGCAAASSGSAATPGATGTPAGASGTPAGTGSTPSSASSPGSPGSGSWCTGRAAQAGAAYRQRLRPGPGPGRRPVRRLRPQGWVAGAGRIMATSDGGASWTRQYTGSAALDQVDFIDGEHGWAAGGDTLLRTVNGGATWTALAEPCQGELTSIHFVSPALGYAVAAATVATPAACRGRHVRAGHRRLTASHHRRRRDLDAGVTPRRQPAERLLRQRRRRLPRHPRPHLADHRRRPELDARADRAGRAE